MIKTSIIHHAAALAQGNTDS